MCSQEINLYRHRHSSEKRYERLKRVFPPCPTTEQQRLLNLGCGHDEYVRPVIESLGYQYVGLEYEPSINPSLCGDTHHLPFDSDTFDAVLALAVFEHFHSPWLAIQEVGRVAKENTKFVGEVPQLHPFHGDSYFNFTFLGIERLLEMGDFECVKILPGESLGAHFLAVFIYPLPANPYRKIVNGLFGAAMLCRSLAVKLDYNVSKDKLEEEDSRRVLYLLERQDIIFVGGLKFIDRKNSRLANRSARTAPGPDPAGGPTAPGGRPDVRVRQYADAEKHHRLGAAL